MSWISEYQVFIAVFGSVATVVGGALLNAHLNRKRDDLLRSTSAKALARALAAEIAIVGQSAGIRMNSFQSAADGKFNIRGNTIGTFRLPETVFLSKMPPEIGVFPYDLVDKIVTFGALLKEAQLHIERYQTREEEAVDVTLLRHLVKAMDRLKVRADELAPKLKDFGEH